MNERLVFIVDTDGISSRLDKYLSQQTAIATRSRAEHLLDAGLVLVNGNLVKSSYKLKQNDRIEVQIPQATPTNLQPLDIKLDILFEDSDIIVVNKPSGLVVHPAAGHQNDTLVNALLAHTKDLSMKFGEDRPGIVHRIDKETSGLLVIAKNDQAHQHLSEQFKNRTINRLYEALCAGVPRFLESTITSVISRHPKERKKFSSLKDSFGKIIPAPAEAPEVGKIAITSYKVLKNKTTASLIELKLFTGRTHQIRVHMSEIGHPLLGDKMYSWGNNLAKKISGEMRTELESLDRFMLHAKVLGFVHPKTNEELHFEVDWPASDKAFIEKWFS